MLGMARGAGKAVSGEFSVEKAIKSGKARLVIISKDASDNTKKLFYNKCSYYRVPIYEYSDKISLGHALGQEMRTSVAVLDDNFANNIIDKFGGLIFEST